MVPNIFYFHPYLENIPILTNIFQIGWNHQSEHGPWWKLMNIRSFYNPSFHANWWIPWLFCCWSNMIMTFLQVFVHLGNCSFAKNILQICRVVYIVIFFRRHFFSPRRKRVGKCLPYKKKHTAAHPQNRPTRCQQRRFCSADPTLGELDQFFGCFVVRFMFFFTWQQKNKLIACNQIISKKFTSSFRFISSIRSNPSPSPPKKQGNNKHTVHNDDKLFSIKFCVGEATLSTASFPDIGPRRDVLGQLLHVLRLPDLDAADGTEADHDVVCLVFQHRGREMCWEELELAVHGLVFFDTHRIYGTGICSYMKISIKNPPFLWVFICHSSHMDLRYEIFHLQSIHNISYSIIYWLVVSNIVYFHPEPWGHDPIWRAYFFKGVGTTTN